MDTELDDFIEWLRVLQLPEEDFKRHIRGYFDDTAEMNRYIETRAPQQSVRYAYDDQDRPQVTDVSTRPWPAQPPEPTEAIPVKAGRYKGRRRKR